MIDAGMNTKNAKEIGEGILKEAGLYDKLISEEKPMLIAITHGHGDHMGGLGAFSDLYMSLTDYQQFGVENNYPGIAFHPIKEGDKIDLGERVLEVFENPGHSPGSLAFLDIQNRFLITGDLHRQFGAFHRIGAFRHIARQYSHDAQRHPQAYRLRQS